MFLNIRNTGFDQSSQVQPNPENKNLEKFEKNQKIMFVKNKYQNFENIFFLKKKCYYLCFPIYGGRHSTIALQSTPFQNPGGVAQA